MLDKLDYLLQHFHIDIHQIINNSDNTFDDIKNEGYIVLHEHYDEIEKDNKVFINELRKRCLKFNKYNRRIDTKAKWEEFNNLKENLRNEVNLYSQIDEDTLARFAVATGSALAIGKGELLLQKYMPLMNTLGIIDANGDVDIDALYKASKEGLEATGGKTTGKRTYF